MAEEKKGIAALKEKTAVKKSKFTDVPKGAYYAPALEWAVENGITGGTGEGAFSPNAPCTREQAAAMLWRSKGSPEPAGAENPFTDIAGSDFSKAILWAYSGKITGGTSETTFSPEKNCTKGQALTFLLRSTGKASAGPEEAVKWAREKGILEGQPDFDADADCTRSDIVLYLYRAQKA